MLFQIRADQPVAEHRRAETENFLPAVDRHARVKTPLDRTKELGAGGDAQEPVNLVIGLRLLIDRLVFGRFHSAVLLVSNPSLETCHDPSPNSVCPPIAAMSGAGLHDPALFKIERLRVYTARGQ